MCGVGVWYVVCVVFMCDVYVGGGWGGVVVVGGGVVYVWVWV